MAWTVYIPKVNKDKKFIICPYCDAVIDCVENNIDEYEYDYCPRCGRRVIEEDE